MMTFKIQTPNIHIKEKAVNKTSKIVRKGRIIEPFELGGTLKSHLILLPCSEQGHLQFHQMLRAPSSLTLSIYRDRTSTTSLGNLYHCLTTLIVKSFFCISNLNLPSLSLKPFPLILSQQALLKRLSPYFLQLSIFFFPKWSDELENSRVILFSPVHTFLKENKIMCCA